MALVSVTYFVSKAAPQQKYYKLKTIYNLPLSNQGHLFLELEIRS